MLPRAHPTEAEFGQRREGGVRAFFTKKKLRKKKFRRKDGPHSSDLASIGVSALGRHKSVLPGVLSLGLMMVATCIKIFVRTTSSTVHSRLHD